MSYFDKLPHVPITFNAPDTDLIAVHSPDLPDPVPLHMPMSHEEVSAAIIPLQQNKTCNVYNTRTHQYGKKSGNEQDPDNCRGTTVGTILSKLYATVLECRTSSWVELKVLGASRHASLRVQRSQQH